MRVRNGLPYAVVAAVAVGAVVAGGAVAAQRGPKIQDTGAAPLPGTSIGTTAASPAPSKTPSATVATPSGKTVNLDLAKLPSGRAPQYSYLQGRTVLGGAGTDVTIPGEDDIFAVARYRGHALALISLGDSTQLIEVDDTNKVMTRLPDMSSLVVSDDASQAAAAGNAQAAGGAESRGGSVYFLGDDKPQRLSRPNDFEIRALAVIDGVVYFRSQTSQSASTWNLYSWRPGSSAQKLDSVTSPTAVAPDGSLAASMTTLADYGTCSAVVTVESGRRNWRTCDYRIFGFTPDAATAYGGDSYGDGYADTYAVALDAKSGNLQTKWTSLSFLQIVPEDDSHLLMRVDNGPETAAAIIRCTIATGACELATKPVKGTILLGV